MPKIFISTVPFGEADKKPIELLDQSGFEYVINPLNRKLKPEEVGELAQDCDGLIAGTENIHLVLEKAKSLKIVSRVGIGLDSVPLLECRKKEITVCYTPDAVTMAVVELTIGLMVSLTRKVCLADRNIRSNNWNRLQGKRLEKSIIGLIGFGRTGSNIARVLSEFKPKQILINDVKDKTVEIDQLTHQKNLNISQVTKEEIYHNADIISLHVPLSAKTRNLICHNTIQLLKDDCFLINTSRGGIVNENDLYEALKNHRISGAAIDAFEEEPYFGPLAKLENTLLTQHMGSCSYDCRSAMEIQATEDTIRFFDGQPLLNEVPEEEYAYQES